MTDQASVMSWLEGLAQDDWRQHHSDSEVQEIARSALALLEEREPVRPETVVQTGIGEEPTIHALVCGNCHKIMSYSVVYDFCPWCGRAVKWNDRNSL